MAEWTVIKYNLFKSYKRFNLLDNCVYKTLYNKHKIKRKKNQQCAQEIPSGNMIIFVTFLCTVTTYLGRGNLREEILFWFTV